MKTRNPHAQPLEERTPSPEPESMQKYSDEVRERIAERHVEDRLKAEELVRMEMNETR